MSDSTNPSCDDIRAALALLGKRRLVLSIHDVSFPSAPGEDVGRGSPYTRGGYDFARFACELGFDGLLFGPQGQVSRSNPSPYDATMLSRNALSIDLFALAREPRWAGLVDEAEVAAIAAENPRAGLDRAAHGHVYERHGAVLDRAYQALAAGSARGDAGMVALAEELAAFQRRQAHWLVPDALYDALTRHHGGAHHHDWPGTGAAANDRELYAPGPGAEEACAARRQALVEDMAADIERYAFAQWLVHEQHAGFRAFAAEVGLRLYGDLQVGMSPADDWQRAGLCLAGYRMGAPPSRTNPDGQPWGYRVLDPDQYHRLGEDGERRPGPALRFLLDRVEKALDEYDGLRIDHPHGMVCPWVYRTDDPDPLHAVQSGARLFSSPGLDGHPALARFAIARAEQLAPAGESPRYADDWVRALDPDQVERYAVQIDVMVEAVRARGGAAEEIICEVLSTQPYPLARVTARHGLGRFRVTQKANLDRPDDVYRSENAGLADWVMVGNHDTAPIWRLARSWTDGAAARAQAAYLARKLRPHGDGAEVEALAAELARDRRMLVHAKVADLFTSAAQNVLIFVSDLLGVEEVYNAPGTISEDNWSLRVRPDFRARYQAAAARGEALDLAYTLALALRARGPAFRREHAGLIERLERRGAWHPGAA
ncbi:4-alpha-glucanotransferase [Haliangium sp.]|uniref:4-alpha-glucanotransferase n=1 Tax=Haliangium sp. TaxID=2663208 RepID=UPI003D0FE6A2